MFSLDDLDHSQPAWEKFRAVLLTHRKPLLIFTCCFLGFSGLGILWIQNQAQARLNQTRTRLKQESVILFHKEALPPIERTEIQIFQNTSYVRAMTRFEGSYFAATNGGLLQFSLTGKLIRHFTVLDGLPESDLTCLAEFNGKLFLGTKSQGLVTFDGDHFERYNWLDRKPQFITTLIQDAGKLLVGTWTSGLIEFDGTRFTEIKVEAEKKRLPAIHCLSKYNSWLFVGTYSDGLWIRENDQWLHFTSADGLQSDLVVGVSVSHSQVLAASDFGLSAASEASLFSNPTPKPFREISTLPALSSIVERQGKVFLSQDNGALFSLSESRNEFTADPIQGVERESSTKSTGCCLTVCDDTLWVLSNHGILKEKESNSAALRLSFSPFGQHQTTPFLSDNLISALAFDAERRLWIGTFNHGIDIVSEEGRPISHLESESIREINFLFQDSEAKTMLAATSQGVHCFEPSLQVKRFSKVEGLPSNSVAQVIPCTGETAGLGGAALGGGHQLMVATGRGLSVGQADRLRGLVTIQGLPNNNVFSVLPLKRSILVGTLDGLAEVQAGRVTRVFKDSNSKLTNNWVTGLCCLNSRVFVGTYGGGVFELLPSGDFYSFVPEIGKVSVNPNAFWGSGGKLYVGTLDGVWVLDANTQKWIHLKSELPSSNVLSITDDEQHIYVGTTGGMARIEKSYFQ